MCLMGYTLNRNQRLPRDHVTEGMRVNDDGWGFMYVDPQTMRVVGQKGLGTPYQFEEAYRKMPSTFSGHAFHFRYGTSGGKTVEMAHPFEILNADTDGIDLWMMHNGELRGDYYDGKDHTRSDTVQFIDNFLRPTLKRDPYMLRVEGFRKMISAMLGNPNKFLFLDNEGNFITINEWQGEWHGGFWYSNSGYKPYRSSYYGTKGGGGSSRAHRPMSAYLEGDLDGYGIYGEMGYSVRPKNEPEVSAVSTSSTVTTSASTDAKVETKALAKVEVTITDVPTTGASCAVSRKVEDEEKDGDEDEMILSSNMLYDATYEEIGELVTTHPEVVTNFLFEEYSRDAWRKASRGAAA